MAALDIGYKPGISNMTEKPKLLFLLGAVSYIYCVLHEWSFFPLLEWCGSENFSLTRFLIPSVKLICQSNIKHSFGRSGLILVAYWVSNLITDPSVLQVCF